jgi:hypothetical protein
MNQPIAFVRHIRRAVSARPLGRGGVMARREYYNSGDFAARACVRRGSRL